MGGVRHVGIYDERGVDHARALRTGIYPIHEPYDGRRGLCGEGPIGRAARTLAGPVLTDDPVNYALVALND